MSVIPANPHQRIVCSEQKRCDTCTLVHSYAKSFTVAQLEKTYYQQCRQALRKRLNEWPSDVFALYASLFAYLNTQKVEPHVWIPSAKLQASSCTRAVLNIRQQDNHAVRKLKTTLAAGKLPAKLRGCLERFFTAFIANCTREQLIPLAFNILTEQNDIGDVMTWIWHYHIQKDMNGLEEFLTDVNINAWHIWLAFLMSGNKIMMSNGAICKAVLENKNVHNANKIVALTELAFSKNTDVPHIIFFYYGRMNNALKLDLPIDLKCAYCQKMGITCKPCMEKGETCVPGAEGSYSPCQACVAADIDCIAIKQTSDLLNKRIEVYWKVELWKDNPKYFKATVLKQSLDGVFILRYDPGGPRNDDSYERLQKPQYKNIFDRPMPKSEWREIKNEKRPLATDASLPEAKRAK